MDIAKRIKSVKHLKIMAKKNPIILLGITNGGIKLTSYIWWDSDNKIFVISSNMDMSSIVYISEDYIQQDPNSPFMESLTNNRLYGRRYTYEC